MATVHDTRHQNLLRLIEELGDIQALADRIERSHSQVSQLKNRSIHSQTGAPRQIGDAMARHIERKLHLDVGWMDSHHPTQGYERPVGSTALVLNEPAPFNTPQMSWEALMRPDQTLPAVFRVRVPDDAMAPRVRAGDVVELNADTPPKPGDGVLVRDRSGAVYLRSYRERHGAEWEAYPINDAYRTLTSENDHLAIVAVVVGVPVQRWS